MLTLPPFKAFLASNIPSVYDNTLSYYDELTKLIAYLEQQVVPVVNETAAVVGSLKEYVDHYFDNLDVQEEINNKLDEMVEDGTLTDIIAEYFDEVDEKIKSAYTISNLPVQRKSRTIVEKASTEYYAVQGGCYVGNDQVVKALVKADNQVELVEFNYKTNVVVRTGYFALGHCNGLAYDATNKKIYAAGLTGAQSKSLFIIDYTTFTLENTIQLAIEDTDGVSGIAIDGKTGKFYITAELSVNPHSIKLYEMNPTTYELTLIDINDPFDLLSTTANNQIAAYNGVVYLTKYNPTALVGMNVEKGNISCIYNLPVTTEQGYWFRDPEFITFINDGDEGQILIGTAYDDCISGEWYITQIFETNLMSGCPEMRNFNRNASQAEFYVDITSAVVNPDGSASKPFKTLGEALDMSAIIDKATYYLVGATDTAYPKVRIMPRHKAITIRSQGDKCQINGIEYNGTFDLKLVNVRISDNAKINASTEQMSRIILANVTTDTSADNITIRNIELQTGTIPAGSTYNVSMTGESNAFLPTDSTNLANVHFSGTGNITLLGSKTLGSIDISSTTTSADGIDVSNDTTIMNASRVLKVVSYINYSRTYFNAYIPAANASSIVEFVNNSLILRARIYRTSENILYATLESAFSINNDGTLSDVTSTTSGTFSLSLIQA